MLASTSLHFPFPGFQEDYDPTHGLVYAGIRRGGCEISLSFVFIDGVGWRGRSRLLVALRYPATLHVGLILGQQYFFVLHVTFIRFVQFSMPVMLRVNLK